METMRARAESSSLVPVKVEESCTIYSEVFSSGINNTVRFRPF